MHVKTGKSNTPWTAEEIASLVLAKNQGKSFKSLKQEYQRSEASLNTMYANWKVVTQGNAQPGRLSQSTRDTITKANAILNGAPTILAKDINPSVTEDPFDKVNRTLEAFVDSVVEIAKGQAKEATQKQLEEQRLKYEKQLEHYQELLVVAQNSNMVGFIKKKLGITNGVAEG